MDRQKTGALIAQMRKDRGLTQRELAEQLRPPSHKINLLKRAGIFPVRFFISSKRRTNSRKYLAFVSKKFRFPPLSVEKRSLK